MQSQETKQGTSCQKLQKSPSRPAIPLRGQQTINRHHWPQAAHTSLTATTLSQMRIAASAASAPACRYAPGRHCSLYSAWLPPKVHFHLTSSGLMLYYSSRERREPLASSIRLRILKFGKQHIIASG